MFPCLCIWNQWLANCNHQTNKFLSTGLDYFCLFLFSFPTQHHQQAPAPQVLRLPLSGELIEGSPERTTDIIQVEQPGPHLILLLTYLLTTCHDLMVELLCSILFVLCLCIRLLFITFFSIFTWLKNFFSLLLSSALFFSLLFSFFISLSHPSLLASNSAWAFLHLLHHQITGAKCFLFTYNKILYFNATVSLHP